MPLDPQPGQQAGQKPLRRPADGSARSLLAPPTADAATSDQVVPVAALNPTTAQTVAPLPWTGARPGKCYENVNRFVSERGGGFVNGWALADYGPQPIRQNHGHTLYSRWVHHIIWENLDHRLWELTPYYDVNQHRQVAWMPTTFIVDASAVPQIVANGSSCCMLPARYVPTCDEGRRVVDCLDSLQQDGSQCETYWLHEAMRALQEAGSRSVEWHVEWVDGRLNNVWFFADLGNDGMSSLKKE